jgi:hypothetical protein
MIRSTTPDHITVSLNKANAAVLKSLEETDTENIIGLVNWVLIHDMTRWQMHYPLGVIRRHVWEEAGKTKEEMDAQPVFFDIAYENSPFLKRVAKLPIFGDKVELAQFDGAYKITQGNAVLSRRALTRHMNVRSRKNTRSAGLEVLKGAPNLEA